MNQHLCIYAAAIALLLAAVGLDPALGRAAMRGDDVYVDQARVLEILPDDRMIRVGEIQDPGGTGASVLAIMKRAHLILVDPSDPLYYFESGTAMLQMLKRTGLQPQQRVLLFYRVAGDRKVLTHIQPYRPPVNPPKSR